MTNKPLLQNIINILYKYQKYIISLAIICFILLIAVPSVFYFKNQKKAALSAEIAIGLANLKEGKSEKALYFLQNAFNKSSGVYRMIAGSGILNIVQHEPEKIYNLIDILKNEENENLISPLLDSVYFSNLAASGNKDFIAKKGFQKFELSTIKSDNNVLKEQLANIFLNLEENEKFNSIVESIKNDNNASGFTVEKRFTLLKSLQ